MDGSVWSVPASCSCSVHVCADGSCHEQRFPLPSPPQTSEKRDEEVEQKTWSETEEEIAKGWFWVDTSGSWEGEIIAHRFGILQKLKLRTIDDCSVGGLNCSVGLPEKLRVHSIDVLASMLRRALEISGGLAKSKWLGRTYDLQAAYRQFGISPMSRQLLRIVVNKPGTSEPVLLGANSLPFGAGWVSSSVYGAVDHWPGPGDLLVCLLRRLPDCHK